MNNTDPGQISIRRYILLLASIILALSLSLTLYLVWSNQRLNEKVMLINQFHLASATICDRISEELQSVRAHHAEEHLAQVSAYTSEGLPAYQRDHFAAIQKDFAKLAALWETYKDSSLPHPEMQGYQEGAAHRLGELEPVWSGERNTQLIDPLFEATLNALLAFSTDMTLLERLHVRIADEMGEQLTRERAWHERILYLLAMVLVTVGLLVGRKILRLILEQVHRRVIVEQQLGQQQIESQNRRMEMYRLRRSNRAMVMALADLAENRDGNTGEHVQRVARIAHEIAVELRVMGVEEVDAFFLEQIALSSMLHDVGKVSTPDQILLKPGALTAEERVIMQQHAKAGSEILDKIASFQEECTYFTMANRIARSHHEQYQGGGYPDGLVGESIPLEARIVAVADVYDALTSWRPYKQPWTKERADRLIQEQAGKLFDPKVVTAFFSAQAQRAQSTVLQWCEEMSVGIPLLDNDHVGLITLINQLDMYSKHSDPVAVELVLDELYNYTCRHFSREEAFLREMGFPHLVAHSRQHGDFANRVTELRKNCLSGQVPAMAEALTELMSHWLAEHILRDDKLYADWCVETGRLTRNRPPQGAELPV
ncbi:MAG: bacteriohemerythrin [Magnetococcales bacterium]|nr:bacteriohemerythrin [Magnetococcales bacterium]